MPSALFSSGALMFFLLILTTLFVGFLCGSTGVGGIILVPALTFFAGLDTHTAMGTALASFIFSATQIGWLYHRRGFLDMSAVWPMVAGSVPAGFVGAKVKSLLMAPSLNAMLAMLILLAAANILMPARAGTFSFATAAPKPRWIFLCVLGAFVGFMAGLTGVGGAIVTIPVMVYFGFSPLISIAAGQAFAVGSALSGTAGNLLYGKIDWYIMAWITVVQMSGTVLGVRLACRVPTQVLRMTVAVTCIVIALLLLGQSLTQMGILRF